jgi:hypothetical protein
MKYIIILLATFITLPCFAQGTNIYSRADWSSRAHYPKDKLVGCWDFLDTYATGDIFVDTGDMEVWDGSHAQCTDCPTGFDSCACTGTTADITPNTTELYKNSTSALMYDGDGYAQVVISRPLNANVCYQISWLAMAETGTADDFNVRMHGSSVLVQLHGVILMILGVGMFYL